MRHCNILLLSVLFGFVSAGEEQIQAVSPPRIYDNGQSLTFCVEAKLSPMHQTTQLCGPIPQPSTELHQARTAQQLIQMQQLQQMQMEQMARDAEPPCATKGINYNQRPLYPQMYPGLFPGPPLYPVPPMHGMGRLAEERSIIIPPFGAVDQNIGPLQGPIQMPLQQQQQQAMARSECDEQGRSIITVPARAVHSFRSRSNYMRAAEPTADEILKECDDNKKLIKTQEEKINKLQAKMDKLDQKQNIQSSEGQTKSSLNTVEQNHQQKSVSTSSAASSSTVKASSQSQQSGQMVK